jgi:hypothetical protein
MIDATCVIQERGEKNIRNERSLDHHLRPITSVVGKAEHLGVTGVLHPNRKSVRIRRQGINRIVRQPKVADPLLIAEIDVPWTAGLFADPH